MGRLPPASEDIEPMAAINKGHSMWRSSAHRAHKPVWPSCRRRPLFTATDENNGVPSLPSSGSFLLLSTSLPPFSLQELGANAMDATTRSFARAAAMDWIRSGAAHLPHISSWLQVPHRAACRWLHRPEPASSSPVRPAASARVSGESQSFCAASAPPCRRRAPPSTPASPASPMTLRPLLPSRERTTSLTFPRSNPAGRPSAPCRPLPLRKLGLAHG